MQFKSRAGQSHGTVTHTRDAPVQNADELERVREQRVD